MVIIYTFPKHLNNKMLISVKSKSKYIFIYIYLYTCKVNIILGRNIGSHSIHFHCYEDDTQFTHMEKEIVKTYKRLA